LELLEQFLEVIVGKPYLREHLGVYYNSLGVLLAYNGRLYASYDALQRGLEVMGSLDGSEVHLRLLINLSDTALELEGPSASFKYVNAAFRSTAPCNLALRATLQPSIRGEYEITDVNKVYLAEGTLDYDIFEGWWIDAGTFDSLHLANILCKDLDYHGKCR